jgi:hypothetical protein
LRYGTNEDTEEEQKLVSAAGREHTPRKNRSWCLQQGESIHRGRTEVSVCSRERAYTEEEQKLVSAAGRDHTPRKNRSWCLQQGESIKSAKLTVFVFMFSFILHRTSNPSV